MARRLDAHKEERRAHRWLHPHAQIFAVAALGLSLFLGYSAWPGDPYRIGGFGGLVLGAILLSAVAPRPSRAQDATMTPAFVVEFCALLLLGPDAMTLVALGAALGWALRDGARGLPSRRLLLGVGTGVIAALAAGFAYRLAGGTVGPFVWPWQGVPLALALLVHCIVTAGLQDFGAPLLTGRSVARVWPKDAFRGCSTCSIGVGVAVAMTEAIHHGAWTILPLAAVPLYFAYRAYTVHFARLDDEVRHRGVLESLDQSMAVVDRDGRVALWNAALAGLLGCAREQAVGRSLAAAVPALGQPDLTRAVQDVLTHRVARSVARLELAAAGGSRILQVHVLPEGDGATLLWHDVTEWTRSEQSLKRDAGRLALAAEGANDGLWALDLRTQEFYVSARWRTMIGLAPQSGIGRREEWLDRVHPDDVVSLKDAFDAHLSGRTEHVDQEHRIRHEDGTYRWFRCRGLAARGADGRPDRIGGSLTDITQQTAEQERTRNAGSCDPLTGLLNRTVFVDMVGKGLKDFKQRHTGRFAVLYLDVDRFKIVNDSLGHLVGDELLIAVSRRLESCLRPADLLARLGGDEFAILLNGLGDDAQANVVAMRIQDAMGASFSIGGREVFASVSIGIAVSRTEYAQGEEIMRDADTAMYQAKAHGRARHELFDADMHARAVDRLSLEGDLRVAVKNRALEVHYQPIVTLSSGMCAGFEALVRWKRDGKPVSPADFIPIAEELGLIEAIGASVLQEACRRFADWQQRHPAAGLEYITVNVSARQLIQQGFVRLVEQTVEETRMRPADLRLEITETALMDNPRHAAEVIGGLRDFGVKIYLDDFGTGFSSLSHLHKLPVDALKIDRSFVRSLLLTDRPAIVESILALARTLETGVVAEGVESEQQARELHRLGCRYAQGFYFSPPLAAPLVEELLIANQPLGKKPLQPSDQAA